MASATRAKGDTEKPDPIVGLREGRTSPIERSLLCTERGVETVTPPMQ